MRNERMLRRDWPCSSRGTGSEMEDEGEDQENVIKDDEN